MRDSVVIYRSFYESMEGLDGEVKAQLWDAICELSFNLKEIELTGIAKNIFRLIKPQIEANIKRYENGKQAKNKQDISKLEAKPKQKKSKNKGCLPLAYDLLDNDNVSVNDNDNVNVTKNDTDNFNASIVKYYNEVKKSNYKLTDELKKDLNTIQNDGYTLDDCMLVINFIINDEWYKKGGWTGLDNIFRPTKFADKLGRAKQILENNTSRFDRELIHIWIDSFTNVLCWICKCEDDGTINSFYNFTIKPNEEEVNKYLIRFDSKHRFASLPRHDTDVFTASIPYPRLLRENYKGEVLDA
jgi:uncharacterized phage protein (TIGR02220 family)